MRALCLAWGLPHNPDRDEWAVAEVSLRLLGERFNPHYFIHPSVTLYVHSILFAPYYLAGRAVGGFSDVFDFVGEFSVDPSGCLLMARGVACVAAVATVIVWYKTARRMVSWRGALMLCCLLSLSPLLIEYSVIAKSYSVAGLCVAGGVFFCVRFVQQGTWKDCVYACVLLGLAASSHYAAAFCAPAAAIAPLVRERRISWMALRRGGISLALMVVTFVAGTPFAVVNPREFIGDLLLQGQVCREGWYSDMLRGSTPAFYASFLLYEEMGPIVVACVVLGAHVLVRRRERVGVIVVCCLC